MSLISTAVLQERIGYDRMQNNFRKLLKHHARDLKKETGDNQQRAVVGFLSSYASAITREVFSNRFIESIRTMGLTNTPLEVTDRRKIVEEYLRNDHGHADGANICEPTKPEDDKAPINLTREHEVDWPNEDSDQDSVEEAPGEDELYDGTITNVDRVSRFILHSVAYRTLHCRLHEFVHPSLQTRLRNLVTAWSKSDHKYHAFVTRYKLFNLVAELRYVQPSNLRFDRGAETGYLHRVTGWCQDVVERSTQESWDWWPLPPCLRPLEDSETRVWWKCVSRVHCRISSFKTGLTS